MIKIRLRRMGAKKRPFYRIVVAEHSMKRDGRFIENLGHYDPLTDPATLKVNAERVQHWLSVGAKPSETMEHLLKKEGIIPADKIYNNPRAEKKSKAPKDAAPATQTASETEGASAHEEPSEMPAAADEEQVVTAEPIEVEETPEKPVEAVEKDPAEGPAEADEK